MSARAYTDAVKCLNALESNAQVLKAVVNMPRNSERSLPEMRAYWHRLGYSPEELNRLNAIHITGTKGKGSTAAFIESILRRSTSLSSRSITTGLYTSPHLVEVRERIRINGKPLERDAFAHYFYECYDKFTEAAAKDVPVDGVAVLPTHPSYFRFMTLLAFHVFLRENVDAAVIEVGIGGEYDATNILPAPVATVVTAIGYDHQSILGSTLSSIAWNKGGIFKPGAYAVTCAQSEETMKALRERAQALHVQLDVQDQLPSVLEPCRLGIKGEHQKQNAALAVSAGQAWWKRVMGGNLFDVPNGISTLRQALERTSWPGRSQVVASPQHSNLTWYLDGAHTRESVQVCADWYHTEMLDAEGGSNAQTSRRILVFNCTKGRDPFTLLHELSKLQAQATSRFDEAIFCTNTTYSDKTFRSDLFNATVDVNDVTSQQIARNAWTQELDASPSAVFASIQEAVEYIHGTAQDVHGPVRVLVTGSLHLVGGVLALLEPAQ